MLTFLGDIIKGWYTHLGYGGIVLAMALESCLLPLPSEIVMPLAGAFTVAGFAAVGPHFSLVGVALAGAVGCVIGSLAAYAIGAAGGRPFIFRYGKYLLISHQDFDRADRWFLRYGSAITFISRLLPVVRTYISLPAGIARMPLGKFILFTFLGSLPWCFVLAFIGQQLGSHYDQLGTVFHGFDAVIIVAIVVLVGLYIYRHIRQERAYQQDLAATDEAATSKRPTTPRA